MSVNLRSQDLRSINHSPFRHRDTHFVTGTQTAVALPNDPSGSCRADPFQVGSFPRGGEICKNYNWGECKKYNLPPSVNLSNIAGYQKVP